MKKSFAFTLITALALCVSQVCHGQAKKTSNEANKLAREGAEAAKNQDWTKPLSYFGKLPLSTTNTRMNSRLFINGADTQTPANRSTKTPSLNMAKRSNLLRKMCASTSNAQRLK